MGFQRYVVLKTALEKEGKVKVEVPQLVPSTAEEILEYGLAERRRSLVTYCHILVHPVL